MDGRRVEFDVENLKLHFAEKVIVSILHRNLSSLRQELYSQERRPILIYIYKF